MPSVDRRVGGADPKLSPLVGARRRAGPLVGVALVVASVLAQAPAAAQAPVVGTVFVVNSTSDPGSGGCDATECTLREAIEAANANCEDAADTIGFDIPGPVPVTIRPTSPLPEVESGVVVDGWSQPGFAGTPVVEVDGSLAGETTYGFTFTGTQCNDDPRTVQGLVINRFGRDGILNSGSSTPLVVDGCYVGTDPSGLVAAGNGLNGIGDVNHISGIAPLVVRDSVLSGNSRWGIAQRYGSVTVTGSMVGTDPTGTVAVPNGQGGIYVAYGRAGVVGGRNPGEGNVISGNHGPGVWVEGGGPTSIWGNWIGTDVTGTRPLGNTQAGVLGTLSGFGVGGTGAGMGNIIAANGGAGIEARDDGVGAWGNWIGTDQSGRIDLGNGGPGIALVGARDGGTIGGDAHGGANVIDYNAGPGVSITADRTVQSVDVRIAQNEFRRNHGLAVDLDGDGPTVNDPGDGDEGANHDQNHPVLATAVARPGSTKVIGVLDTTATGTFVVDLYAAPVCGPSGRGLATVWLAAKTVTTDATGHVQFASNSPVIVPVGWRVAATATDDQSTSEFSPCVTVTEG